MNKIPLPNLPNYTGNDWYQKILRVKLDDIFSGFRNLVNRLSDGYLFPSVTVTGDYIPTLNDSLILADATAARLSVTLPDPGEWKDREYIIKKIDSSSNTVTGVGTIDGVSGWKTNTQYASQAFRSDGANIWKV